MRAAWSAQSAVASCRRALVENQEDNNDKLRVEKSEEMEHALSLNQKVYEQHATFFRNYIISLAKELRPTASYQRHITALHILSSTITCALNRYPSPCLAMDLFDQGAGWAGQESYTKVLLRSLFDLIMDPFDDVRNIANVLLTEIMENVWISCFDSPGIEHSYDSLRCEVRRNGLGDHLDLFKLFLLDRTILSATGRADHSDGVGRIFCLTWQSYARCGDWHASQTVMIETTCFELEKDIEIARSDLNLAVSKRPLHGHLIALRYT